MTAMKTRSYWSQLRANQICKSLSLVAAVSCAAVVSTAQAEPEQSALVTAELQLSAGKKTDLGLYVTGAEAYEKWKAAPDKVKIIDVRTPEEYAFIGHPETAWNVPLAFVTYERKDGKTEHGAKFNADFVKEIKSIAEPQDTLLVMCRSGDRSAMAVNKLAAAGFKNAYTIVDGFEGDKVTDPGSVFLGRRMKNGWKNSAPWTYSIDPEKIILEEGSSKETAPGK